jgi:thymidylate synthase
MLTTTRSNLTPVCEHCYQPYPTIDAHKHKDGKCNEICVNCGTPVHPNVPCSEVMVGYNQVDDEYFDLLRLILEEGTWSPNRTGIDTLGVFGAQAKFQVDLDAFPILTTKKVWFKGIVHELLWFLRGDTNIKYLVDNDVHIWDEWAYQKYKKAMTLPPSDVNSQYGVGYTQEQFIELIRDEPKDSPFVKAHGDLGMGTYGGMWRNFPCIDPNKIDYDYVPEDNVDQIQKVLDKLKFSPTDRRMIVSAWHPYWVDHCALPPCHCLFHFNTQELTKDERREIFRVRHPEVVPANDVEEQDWFDQLNIPKRRLNLLLYQRSCDVFLGVPFNITSYCLLLAMVAHVAKMEPGVFTHTYGDLHIYRNHMTQVDLQMGRTPKLLPKLRLNPDITNLFDFKFEDIKLIGYEPHPAIKAEVAV